MKQKQQVQGSLPKKLLFKKPYRSPKLIVMGDVRDLTLAPSFGTFESGPGAGYRA